MSHIATLVKPNGLAWGDVTAACDAIAAHGWDGPTPAWLDEGSAADIVFAGGGPDLAAAVEAVCAANQIDAIIQPTAQRRRALLVADMDSTMITCECIDELADYAGLKPQIAAITEQAMRGELDFEGALRGRVALLAGLPETVIAACLHERVQLMPGAMALVRTLRAHGGRAVLVSGGFTRFADPVGAQIGFDRVLANRLGIRDGVLDGTVDAPIVDAETKRRTLLAECAALGVPGDAALAVGDGANDIPMITAAGLGVAYHAKPKTAAAAAARITYGDLSVLLYALGYPRGDWVTA